MRYLGDAPTVNRHNQLRVALEELAELPAPEETPPLLAPPSNVEALAGTWEDPYAIGTVTFTWDGAELEVDAPDLVAADRTVGDTLVAYAEDVYFLSIDLLDRELDRYTDANGEYLIAREFGLKRVSEQGSEP